MQKEDKNNNGRWTHLYILCYCEDPTPARFGKGRRQAYTHIIYIHLRPL